MIIFYCLTALEALRPFIHSLGKNITNSAYITTSDSRPVCLGVRHPSEAQFQILLLPGSFGFVDVGPLLWWEDGCAAYSCCWFSPMQSSTLTEVSVSVQLEHWQKPAAIVSYTPVLSSEKASHINKWSALTQSESQSYIMTNSQSASLSWCQTTIWDSRLIFILLSLIIFRQLQICWCGAPSLMRSRVCSFQFLLGITSTVFLGSESHGTHEHILLSLFLRPPTCRARFLYLFPPGTE
jgi:hypothetical protein